MRLEQRRLATDVIWEVHIREKLEIPVDEDTFATCGRRRNEAHRPGVDVASKRCDQLCDLLEEILFGKWGKCMTVPQCV